MTDENDAEMQALLAGGIAVLSHETAIGVNEKNKYFRTKVH